ncbi:MAG: hypothetical protein ACRDG3_06370 [Tepidiformaceae bacterium]
MGFYYGSGQPPEDDGSGGFREVVEIIWVVLRMLAIPLGVLLGIVVGLALIFWLFTVNPLLGLGAILLIIAAVVARGVWEAKHPPDIR